MKMWPLVLCSLLLCATGPGSGPGPAGAQAPQEAYDQLSDIYRQGVDLAFEQLNLHAGVQHHFRFSRTVATSEIEGGFGLKYIYHHFHLKPTTCAKGSTDMSAQSCPFRNDRPLMDCAMCYKAHEQIESSPKPYVHCIQKRRLTQDMKTARIEHCKKMSYNSGAPTLLAVSTDEH